LTAPFLEPSRPDYSPKGEWIAFQAFAGGTFHIWRMKPDGNEIQQLTTGHGDDRDPQVLRNLGWGFARPPPAAGHSPPQARLAL
jgi:Tol biopolymer transport system component